MGGEEPRWQHTDALCISRSMQLHNIEDPSNLQVLTAVSEPHAQPNGSATASADDAANNEHAGRLGHIGLRRPTWVESSALQEEANDDSAPAASAAKKTSAMLKAAGVIKHSDAPLPRRICPAAYCHQVMK